MKTFRYIKGIVVPFLGLVALLTLFCLTTTGCKTTGLGFNCETAKKAYDAYQVSLAFHAPSPQEAAIARAAAIFLTMQCGWEAPPTPPGAKVGPPVDANGVPVIAPPGAKARSLVLPSLAIPKTNAPPFKARANDPDHLFIICEDGSVRKFAN